MKHAEKKNNTRLAFRTTNHCLTGCAAGEILGFALGAWLAWATAQTIFVSVVLAFIFSYALTMWPLLRSGMAMKAALGIALAADTVSVTSMETVDNVLMVFIPGAMDAMPNQALFWWSLALALGVAYAVTLPLNLWLIVKGWGHREMHGKRATPEGPHRRRAA